jgi:hypothetical protein
MGAPDRIFQHDWTPYKHPRANPLFRAVRQGYDCRSAGEGDGRRARFASAGRVGKGPRAVSNIGLTEQEQEELRQRIRLLEIEHGDLDDVIAKLALDPTQDQLQLRRLKKRKLLLKDTISRLRDQLIPDIIA